MKNIKLFALAAFLYAGASLSAWYDDVRLGIPEYGGTGCPGGSAGVVLSPDAQSLSILFDRFIVEAGGSTGRSTERKTCNIAVPVHVPQGYSVSIFRIDYRGFNSLPYGAYSRFNVEYFFAGGRGPEYSRTFNGLLEEEFLLNNSIAALAWSDCGQSVILRANTGLTVRTNDSFQDTFATIDSADISAGLLFNLRWRRC